MPVFTAGLFLFSALAIAVPLALHLLHRRQPKPVMFAAVRFMRDAIAKSRRSRRLTQGLTLLMRCLILLLLALAFSQPYLRQSNYLPEGSRKLLLVLDASATMQARDGDQTLFEHCQTWSQNLLDMLNDGDTAGLLVAGENGRVEVAQPISDLAHIRELLSEARCSFGSVDLAAAIQELLREDGDMLKDFELHVFSDFQRGSWRADSVKALAAELERRHCAVFLNTPLKGAVSDAGIMKLSFAPPAIIGEGPFSCRYSLAHTENYSGTLTVRLIGEGREQDQVTAVLPGAELTDRLTGQAGPSEDNGELTGEVALDDDRYALNDHFYFSLARLSGQAALIVNGSGDERDSFFLTRALKPQGMAFSHVIPETKDWSGLQNTAELARYAMVFLCNPPPMDATVVNQLSSYVKEGGMLVMFPGALNGLDEKTLQTLLDSSGIHVMAEQFPEEKAFQLTADENRAQDTLVRRMVTMIPPPWQITARRRLPLKVDNGVAERFISTISGDHYDGYEFVVRRSVGNGEVMVCAVSANRDWSDMPLTPFYFVLIQELSRHGAGYRHRGLQVKIGDELALPLVGVAKDISTVHGTDMNGRKCELSAAIDSSGKMLLLSGFHAPGTIAVQLPWGTVRQIAVNIPDDESTLDCWTSAELLGGQFGGLPVAYSTSHDELHRQMNLAGRRFPLSPWMLIGAFILNMIEVIYANIRSLRPAQPKTVETLLKNGGGVA